MSAVAKCATPGTLTLTRLQIRGPLKRTLQSTNPIESMIEIVRRTSRNVKRWQLGDMCLRWTAAGMLEAETQFRKIIGYRDLARLAVAAHPRLTITTPGPPSRSSTTTGTTSRPMSLGPRVSRREPSPVGYA